MHSILYVDDEESLLSLSKLFLESMGLFSVDTLTSAPEAIERMKAQHYDAILSDYQMPDMDGIRFLKQVRSLFGDIPFILFTGKGREEVVIEAIDNGVDYYLQKGGAPTALYAELAHKIIHAIERRQAKSELALFKDSVDGASDQVFWLDKDGNILYVNQAACKNTGYSREEFSKMNIFDIDPDINPDMMEPCFADLRQRKTRLFTTRHRRKDGSVTDIEIMANYVARDGLEYSFAFARDISEKIRTIREFEESEERYRRLLEQFFDAVIIHQDKVIVYANDSAARLTKTENPAGMIGKHIMEYVYPKCEQLVAERVRTMSSAPKTTVPLVEERFICADGTTVDVEVIATSTSYHGKPAIQVIARDITRIQRIEKDREECTARYRLILDSANDAILIHAIENDRPGRFLEVNPQTCRMLGYSRDELLCMSIADIDIPEQAGKFPGIQNQLNTTGNCIFQTDHVARDGRRIPVEVSARLIELEEKPAVLSIVRDRSEQKKAEKKLLEANRKRSLLNSITRHDIRNKVSALETCLDLVKQTGPDTISAGSIAKMESATRSICDHIEFMRIYQDLGTTEPGWQEIKTAISHARSVSSPVIMHEDIEGIFVYADPLFKNVFSNLHDNTLRHGGDVTRIQVSVRQSPEGLVIAWEDDGVGIPAHEKEKIFTQGYGRNTGLGLFLCSEILSITNISMRETGIPGKGARFEIVVPEGGYRFSG